MHNDGMRSLRRSSIGAFAVVLSIASIALAIGEDRQRNLYEWCAVASIVASVEVEAYEGRFAIVRLEEPIRGELEPTVAVDLKTANRARGSRALALKLTPGRSYLMLLRPSPRDAPRKLPAYELVRGHRGARILPQEGFEATREAVREFVAIQDMKDFEATWTNLAALLRHDNPLVVEVALAQHLKFQAGDRELVPVLLGLLDHEVPGIRSRSAELVGVVVREAGGGDGVGVGDWGEIGPDLTARARRDPSVQVRVAATRALGVLRGDRARAMLEEIARDDPEQAVRYAAETMLLERRTTAPAGAASPD